MDILIKGMEMPKKGETRYLFIDGDGYVGIWNEGNKGFVYSHEAIPVPEHGDLIDRDAVLKEYNQVGYMWQEVPRIAHEELVHIVYNAPVVLERTT